MTRQWIAADYPSKKRLTESEAEGVLRNGPDLKWFEPWIEHGVYVPSATERKFRFGYVHVHGGSEQPFQCDSCLFWDREALSWALEALHKNHSECDECQGVFYFVPDEPLSLRILIEADDSDDEADQ